MKRLLLILTFFISFIFFLIISAPIEYLFQKIIPTEVYAKVKVNAVTGNLWSGKASGIATNRINLKEVYWQFEPLSLLTLSPRYKLTSPNKDITLSGDLIIRLFDNSYRLEEGTALVELTQLHKTGKLPIKVDGYLLIEISTIDSKKNLCNQLKGRSTINKLSIPLVPMLKELEPISGEFYCDNQQLIQDVQLQQKLIQGELQLALGQTGTYRLQGFFQSNSAELKALLENIDKIKKKQKGYSVNLMGNL